MLEKIKTLYNAVPGMPPDKIGPTVGQNSGLLSTAPFISSVDGDVVGVEEKSWMDTGLFFGL